MGFKYYRTSERIKKIKNRVLNTRSWFRELKWVTCKLTSLLDLLVFRLRAPENDCR